MTSPVSAIIGFPLQGAPNRRGTVAFSQTSPIIGRGRIPGKTRARWGMSGKISAADIFGRSGAIVDNGRGGDDY
ncbi:hypothetical protein [Nocardia abscessus]|uniref:hypothetical protein n=1 Tax=Nocardia abscessus TaxID=120957 RepID=UPI002456F9A0|nr:hypothetical protein [Nocardia abscessus]